MRDPELLLVLGTTANQRPLIQRARQMGLEVWALAIGDHHAVDDVADRVLEIDTADQQSILTLARQHGVRGLVTCATSTAIITVAGINERLGLSPYVPPERVARDAACKERYQRILTPLGLVPRGCTCRSVDEALAWIGERPGLQVFKPADGGGGKGVSIVRSGDRETVAAALAHALRWSRGDRVIIEDYIEGPTFGVESITLDGHTHVLAVPEKRIVGHPNCVTAGVFFPSPRLEPYLERIEEANRRAIAALGLRWGPTHIDMVLRQDGTPLIIDIGPRIAGGPLGWKLIPEATGYDLYAAVTDLAVGRLPEPTPAAPRSRSLFAEHFVVIEQAGTIRSIRLDLSAADVRAGRVRDPQLLKRAGERTEGAVSDADRLAVCNMCCTDHIEMEQRIAAFDAAVVVELDQENE